MTVSPSIERNRYLHLAPQRENNEPRLPLPYPIPLGDKQLSIGNIETRSLLFSMNGSSVRVNRIAVSLTIIIFIFIIFVNNIQLFTSCTSSS